jgi:hypothetical protein
MPFFFVATSSPRSEIPAEATALLWGLERGRGLRSAAFLMAPRGAMGVCRHAPDDREVAATLAIAILLLFSDRG